MVAGLGYFAQLPLARKLQHCPLSGVTRHCTFTIVSRIVQLNFFNMFSLFTEAPASPRAATEPFLEGILEVAGYEDGSKEVLVGVGRTEQNGGHFSGSDS